MGETQRQVLAHYARPGMGERILDALAAAGKDIERLTPEDLAEIDHFHGRRLDATRELAALLAPRADEHVLDVGCGIGGPARHLAYYHRCRVSGVDLTAEFVAVAELLTERTGLSGHVTFRQADALALPFADAGFDAAWLQNATMNIADRPRLYAELARVLKPGGRLAMQDVMQGPNGPPFFPLPWAGEPSISFLRTPQETRALLEAAGFAVLEWIDTTAATLAHAEAERARAAASGHKGPPALGIHLFAGKDFPQRARNTNRSLREGRTVAVNALLRRGA